MDLSEFIEASIFSVIKGVKSADETLQKNEVGEIWKEDFNTISSDLVNLRMAKGQKNNNPKESLPVLIFEYDVNIAVNNIEKSNSSSEISAKAKFLEVVGFSGATKGGSESEEHNGTIQNLKFSIPVHFKGKHKKKLSKVKKQ